MAPRKAKPIDKPILKRKLPMIKVETLPNGYALRFDGMKNQGYMYFSPAKLLEGFMLHIGLDMTEELDIETMQDFIVAATQWNDNKKCVKEIERLNADLKSLGYNRMIIANKLIAERKRLLTLRDAVNKMATKYKGLKDLHQNLLGLTKNYSKLNEYTLGNFTFKGEKIEAIEDLDDDEDGEGEE